MTKETLLPTDIHMILMDMYKKGHFHPDWQVRGKKVKEKRQHKWALALNDYMPIHVFTFFHIFLKCR